jgi:SAM-dependent methyltransferase
MPSFADHFSVSAADYARYRPRYPRLLFDWLSLRAPGRERAWDCGTGSGQAAVALRDRFTEVVATDPSIAQLESAERAEGVEYVAMVAERCALRSHSVDLVTVAQALHWFDRDRFFSEATRVLRARGLIAVWSYGLVRIDAAVDPAVDHFYHETIGPYWPAERRLVDAGYAGIQFPFAHEPAPPFAMEARWTLGRLAGYLSTWSGVRRYRAARGVDPVPALVGELAGWWGEDRGKPRARRIEWPLALRVGRVS